MPPIVYFDTSIFIDLGAKKSRYKQKIKALLKELGQERARIYTSILTVEEISVAAYRPGLVARDTYGEIMATGAKVRGIDKKIALTCAKNEAMLKHLADVEDAKRDKTKPEPIDKQIERACENRRRRWDSFHVATAQVVGCTEFYTTDETLLKRPTQLQIKSLTALRPGGSVRKVTGPIADQGGYIEVR